MKNRSPFFRAGPVGRMMGAGIFALLAFSSCGIKTLPVPPDVYEPPAVKELKASVDGGSVCLTWVVPDGHDQREKGLSETVVFMADQSGACPDCPLPYEPVAKISAWEMAEDGQGNLEGCHRLKVEGQGPFSFYVVGCSEAGVYGPKSDTVETASSSRE